MRVEPVADSDQPLGGRQRLIDAIFAGDQRLLQRDQAALDGQRLTIAAQAGDQLPHRQQRRRSGGQELRLLRRRRERLPQAGLDDDDAVAVRAVYGAAVRQSGR